MWFQGKVSSMRIFTSNKWRGGFLDYFQGPGEYRIQVIAVKNLERVEEAYVVRPKSLKMVLNYLLRFGPAVVLRKIKSRFQEKYRNEKYVSCGVGRVIGQEKIVGFIAPLHPAVAERVVLPAELIFDIDKTNLPIVNENTILMTRHNVRENDWWKEIKGWSKYSGKKLTPDILKKLKEGLVKCIQETDWRSAKKLVTSTEEATETKGEIRSSGAVLFGYGNYAKTQILPNIKKYLKVTAIHEIDPTQIPLNYKGAARWDTSPMPRKDEKYDVYIIAGYHHTHTPIALKALKQNAYALIEKPIVVDEDQLRELLEAVKKSGDKVFAGFHKRYSPLTKLALKDLGGAPINYHSIVYEEPQPKFYWYNWPNSKGPIVSNGCHWIDHFLYLNGYSLPKSFGVEVTDDKRTLNVSMELENGAFFTMAFTDKGSPYLGVQDYVELKGKDKTARIINDSEYIFLNKNGVMRKKKINKALNYEIMYQTIGKKIAAGDPGDSLKSIEISSLAMLELEKIYELQLQK